MNGFLDHWVKRPRFSIHLLGGKTGSGTGVPPVHPNIPPRQELTGETPVPLPWPLETFRRMPGEANEIKNPSIVLLVKKITNLNLPGFGMAGRLTVRLFSGCVF
jgi:hypothetical protein